MTDTTRLDAFVAQTLTEFTAERVYLVISEFGHRGCEGYANDFEEALKYFHDFLGDNKSVVVWAVQLGRVTVDVTDLFDAELIRRQSA